MELSKVALDEWWQRAFGWIRAPCLNVAERHHVGAAFAIIIGVDGRRDHFSVKHIWRYGHVLSKTLHVRQELGSSKMLLRVDQLEVCFAFHRVIDKLSKKVPCVGW